MGDIPWRWQPSYDQPCYQSFVPIKKSEAQSIIKRTTFGVR